MKVKLHLFLILITCAAASVQADLSGIGEIDVQSGPAPEKPAVEDRSTLWIEAKTRVTLLLTDRLGRRVGVDPKSGKVVQEIPGSTCDVDYVANQYTGEPHAEAYERIAIAPAAAGLYKATLRGLQDGPYEVNISALSNNGSSEPSKQLEGLISQREDKVFRLTYDPAPKAELAVVEVESRTGKSN